MNGLKTEELENREALSRRRLLLSAALVWIFAALLIWMWRGWRIGRLEPILDGRWFAEFPAEQLTAFAAATVIVAASFGWGALARRALGLGVRGRAATLGADFLVGQTVVALLVFAVAAVGLLPWGLVVVLGGIVPLATSFRKQPRGSSSGHNCNPVHLVLIGAFAVVFAFTIVLGLAPAMESDGVRYHLFAPQEYLKAEGFIHLPHHAFTNLPLQLNMLFMLGMSVADYRVAHLLHAIQLPAIALFAGLIAYRVQRVLCARGIASAVNVSWAMAAGLLAAFTPVGLTIAAWPIVDLATTAFLLAGTWALLPGSVRSQRGRLILAGILFGAAIGIKLTALVPAFFAGLIVLGIVFRKDARRPALVFAYVLPMLVVAGPWFAKNIVIHGNPVYPAAAGVFGNEEWPAEAQALYQSKADVKGFGRGPVDLALMPLDVTIRWQTNRQGAERIENRVLGVRSTGFEDHNPGPGFLALLPLALVSLLLVARRQRWRGVLFHLLAVQLVGGIAFWFATYHSVRFLLFPMALVVVLAVPLLAAWTERAKGIRIATALAVGAIAASGVAWHVFYTLAGNPRRPMNAAVGMVEKDIYLSTMLNYYDAMDFLNREAQPGERVFHIGEHRGTYAAYEAELSDWFDVPLVLVEIRRTDDNDALLASWRARNVRYLLWNYAELGMYLWSDFRPRFTDEEWERFDDLQERILQRAHIIFTPRDNVYVIDLDLLSHQ